MPSVVLHHAAGGLAAGILAAQVPQEKVEGCEMGAENWGNKWMELDENGGILASIMLPPRIQPSNEILPLIVSIDELKGEWRAVESIKPERLQSLRCVATIESIGSSTRIEGSKLSDREVEIGRIDARYKDFICENNEGKCPHCAYGDIKGLHHSKREAYDHFLPKGTFGLTIDDLLAQVIRAAERSPYDSADFLKKPFLLACKNVGIIRNSVTSAEMQASAVNRK